MKLDSSALRHLVVRNKAVSAVLGTYFAAAFCELIAVVYLWSSACSGFATPMKALPDLSGMARLALALVMGAVCAVVLFIRLVKRDWPSAAFAIAAGGVVALSFPALISVERSVQRWGSDRIAHHAQPIIEAIIAYEGQRGRLIDLQTLERAGQLSPLPSPGVCGASNYELQSFGVGEWELTVVVPVHWCSHALMVRTEPSESRHDDFADGGWRLRCN